eukprot:712219-Rhodomonas_salina.2
MATVMLAKATVIVMTRRECWCGKHASVWRHFDVEVNHARPVVSRQIDLDARLTLVESGTSRLEVRPSPICPETSRPCHKPSTLSLYLSYSAPTY